jgi:hypothetical protein
MRQTVDVRSGLKSSGTDYVGDGTASFAPISLPNGADVVWTCKGCSKFTITGSDNHTPSGRVFWTQSPSGSGHLPPGEYTLEVRSNGHWTLSITSDANGTAGAGGMSSRRGCDDKGSPSLCPSVALAKPPSVLRRGASVTFHGRVTDPSARFRYRITVTRGLALHTEEITTTYHSHRAVAYPRRRWASQRAGTYTVCLVATHDAAPYPVAYDCRTFKAL